MKKNIMCIIATMLIITFCPLSVFADENTSDGGGSANSLELTPALTTSISEANTENGKTSEFTVTLTDAAGKVSVSTSNSNIVSISTEYEKSEISSDGTIYLQFDSEGVDGKASAEITMTGGTLDGRATITVKTEDVTTLDPEPQEYTDSKEIAVSNDSGINGLVKIDGVWYYKQDGVFLTGLQKINGFWRYFDPDTAKMVTGLQQINSYWRYFEEGTGRMVTGLKEIDGSRYYFAAGTGRRLTGLQKSDGYWYYFDPDTAQMVTGLHQINSYWRYFDESTGRMVTGLKKLDGNWYYFAADTGRRLTDLQRTNGYLRYFDPDTGIMLTGLQKSGGYWYYLEDGTGRALTGLQKINGFWRYFDANTCKMLTGFQKVNGYQRYFEEGNGRMVTGFKKIGGSTYYFEANTGRMLKGWQEINGKWYYFNEGDGRLLKGPVDRNGTVTALGITVPADTRSTNLKMEEVANFKGQISQDGSWKWIDASKTTPKRGDIVVYYNPHEQYYSASHVCVCVTDYNGKVYKAVDGNYGGGDGYVRSGYGAGETPNKGWRDSFQDERDGYQNQETAMGVWRCEKYAEQMASAAEDVLAEFKSMGQYKWLQTYIPNAYYGGWCYYLIPIVVARAAQ